MAETVRLRIDGEWVSAPAGAGLASVLFERGRFVTRRSVSGEPRAPLCAMGICHECRVTIDGIAHRRACLAVCRDGMDVRTGEPLPPGPAQEPAPADDRSLECDVAVVGAGPAGIAAASRAAEVGARVVLVDQNPHAGGQIWRHRSSEGLPAGARRWVERLERTSVTRLHGASVVDARPGELLIADEDDRVTRLRWQRLVVATGARELFLPFPGWTLPGVIGVGGAQALAKSGAGFEGREVVVAGSGPLLLPVAALLSERGARVRCVAEQASPAGLARFAASLWSAPGKLAEAAGYRLRFLGVPYLAGTWITGVESDRGAVSEVRLWDGRRSWRVPCDLVACGFGLVPNLELARLLGCRIEAGAVAVDARQQTSVEAVFAAGETTGVGGAEIALVEGQLAGLAAAGVAHAPDAARLRRQRARGRAFATRLARAFAPRDELRQLADPSTPLCRCEDVPLGLVLACGSRREAKLRTRAGMGACQGRVCGSALDVLTDWSPDSVRPPLEPVGVGVLRAAAVASPTSRITSRP